jgi:hypothetical protein
MTELDTRKWGINVRVEHENNGDDGACGHCITPKSNDDVASHNLKGHKSSFEHEEVPASSEAESIIHESSSKSDKRRGYREECDHLSNT